MWRKYMKMSNIVIEQYKELDRYQDNVTTKPTIAFLFKDGTKKAHMVGTLIRGLKHKGTRPIGVEWYGDSIGYMPNEEDIEWVHKELQYVFDRSVTFEDAVRRITE